ncbi:hypothetical protein AMECASPLE_026768, partial [Ameca splendens]
LNSTAQVKPSGFLHFAHLDPDSLYPWRPDCTCLFSSHTVGDSPVHVPDSLAVNKHLSLIQLFPQSVLLYVVCLQLFCKEYAKIPVFRCAELATYLKRLEETRQSALRKKQRWRRGGEETSYSLQAPDGLAPEGLHPGTEPPLSGLDRNFQSSPSQERQGRQEVSQEREGKR